MKKNYLTGAVLPLLAAAAIVGSGFSIWFFNDANVSENVDLSVDVTQVVKAGQFDVASTFKVLFDQTEEGLKNATGISNSSLEHKGITLVFAEGAKQVTTYTAGDNQNATGLTTTITTTINVSNDLANYFDVTGFTKSLGEESTTNYTFTWEAKQTTFDWGNVTFTYASATESKPNIEGGIDRTTINDATWEPYNLKEYEAFSAIIKAAKIKVTYSAVIAAANA